MVAPVVAAIASKLLLRDPVDGNSEAMRFRSLAGGLGSGQGPGGLRSPTGNQPIVLVKGQASHDHGVDAEKIACLLRG